MSCPQYISVYRPVRTIMSKTESGDEPWILLWQGPKSGRSILFVGYFQVLLNRTVTTLSTTALVAFPLHVGVMHATTRG